MSNNKQEIIKRINDINTELGLTNSPPVGGGSVSLRQLLDEILNKLTSVNNSDINGKVLDIFNKIQTIYNWSSNTNTKTNQIYTWFSNIYNELNSTSTSYMKGKINSIYNELLSSSSSSVSGQLQSIYDKIVSSSNSNSVIKSIQWGRFRFKTLNHSGAFGQPIDHNPVIIGKSFLIIEGSWDASSTYGSITPTIDYRYSNSFTVTISWDRPGNNQANTDCRISWQIIEFY